MLFSGGARSGVRATTSSPGENIMPKIQLLLLDDHTLFRVMLSQLLDTDSNFHVVAHCSSSTEALEALALHHVDLVLLDYDLGKRETGFQFIGRARDAGYTGRIFIVTAGMTDADYVRALGHGICGIFLKHSSPELLTEAIHKVMAGETWIDQHCIQALVKAVDGEGSQPHRNELTERERQGLKGGVPGLAHKENGARYKNSQKSGE